MLSCPCVNRFVEPRVCAAKRMHVLLPLRELLGFTQLARITSVRCFFPWKGLHSKHLCVSLLHFFWLRTAGSAKGKAGASGKGKKK